MAKEQKKRNGLSKPLKLFFGVGDAGFNLMSNIDTYYANYFFTNIAKLPLGVIATMTTIASSVDAALSWVYGVFLNKAKPRKWGRYRSWLILVPWVVPILYALQFIRLENVAASAILMTFSMIVSRIAWNIPYVANVSMINVAAKNPSERMSLSSSRTFWNSLGRVVYSYAGPAAVAFFSGMFGEQYSYAATAFAFAALMAAGYLAHFVMFNGYEELGEKEIEQLKLKKAAEKDTKKKAGVLQSIKQNPYLAGLLFSNVSKFIVSFLISGIAVYYFTYVANDPGLMAPYIFASNILGIAASFAAKKIVSKLTARNTEICAYVSMTVILLIGFFVYKQPMFVLVLMCLVQFMMTLSSACDAALFADCAIYSEYKTGYNATGTIMGLMNVPIKVGIITRGVIISACLAIANFDANAVVTEASAELQRGISIGFMIIPAIIIMIAALLLLFAYKLTESKVTEYSAEIQRRKQSQ